MQHRPKARVARLDPRTAWVVFLSVVFLLSIFVLARVSLAGERSTAVRGPMCPYSADAAAKPAEQGGPRCPYKAANGSGCPHARGKGPCLSMMTKDLGLSEEQVQRIQSVRKEYEEETAGLRDRLEKKAQLLRDLLRDPEALEDDIVAAHREKLVLKSELGEQSMFYGLKARSVLTAEQIQKLPPKALKGMISPCGTASCPMGKGARVQGGCGRPL